ncbi:hypothetical protein PUR61_15250 [Streptomyces sp. BE20]|nr:hypothetical protein [Streptomyces sp. BE20]
MSLTGGTPPSTESREELGICPVCRAWVRGPWLADLTAFTALVLRCRPPTTRTRDGLATLLIISTIHR